MFSAKSRLGGDEANCQSRPRQDLQSVQFDTDHASSQVARGLACLSGHAELATTERRPYRVMASTAAAGGVRRWLIGRPRRRFRRSRPNRSQIVVAIAPKLRPSARSACIRRNTLRSVARVDATGGHSSTLPPRHRRAVATAVMRMPGHGCRCTPARILLHNGGRTLPPPQRGGLRYGPRNPRNVTYLEPVPPRLAQV